MTLLPKLLTTTAIGLASVIPAFAEDCDSRILELYNEAVFYDGYNDNIMDAELNDGILRHRNSLYAIRLTDEQLNWFGDDLGLHVVIGALCDNYDRIGNINLALVEKGAESYKTDEVTRVELVRFITPFMNKNKMPDEVPYDYICDAASYIFRDSKLREKYDYWIEFEVFGIPYAANEQVAGCKDRNDVFRGTLYFESYTTPAPKTDEHVFVPIVIKNPEYIGHNLNNYSERGTDEIGKCIKTWEFEVPETVEDGRITLIMSNHGANAGGEEYIRRLHIISFDGEEALTYTPGGVSCEPYRQYNTQGNGIYSNKRPESFWKNYSNWCPGAAIPVREINLGKVEAGTHKVTISVPDAKFADGQGDFPVSMYFQGLTSGSLPAGLYTPEMLEPQTTVTVDGDMVSWTSDSQLDEAVLYSVGGQMLRIVPGVAGQMSISDYEPGVYMLNLRCTDGRSTVKKIIRH